MEGPTPRKKELSHGMVEDGRHLWISSGSTLPLKQEHPKQLAQHHIQVAVEFQKDLQKERLCLSGQPVPLFSQLNLQQHRLMHPKNSQSL